MKRHFFFFTFFLAALIVIQCGDKSTEPVSIELTLLTPIGGEILLVGADIDITWYSKNAGSIIVIEISRDDEQSWQQMAEVENNGSYTWTVTEPESENAFFRIKDTKSQKTATHDNPVQIKAVGDLAVSFFLEYVADPYPTYQTVIWLENNDGTFVQSLFVSAWLAHGGYRSSYVCPTWARNAKWSDGQTEDVDALTGATPEWGVDSNYQFELKNRGVAPGSYRCNIETHIVGDYNILYTGDVEVMAEEYTVEPSPVFIPAQEPNAGLILKNVKMHYGFSNE